MMRSLTRPLLLARRGYVPTYYTKEHEWCKVESGKEEMTMGISNFAQEALGDVVFVDLPKKGKTFAAGESVGAVESVKAASDVYMPIAGTVTAVNEKLADEPGLVNSSALNDGWFIRFKPKDAGAVSKLMDEAAYTRFLASQKKH